MSPIGAFARFLPGIFHVESFQPNDCAPGGPNFKQSGACRLSLRQCRCRRRNNKEGSLAVRLGPIEEAPGAPIISATWSNDTSFIMPESASV